MGAVQNRLQRSVSALSITSENLQAAESAIRDADIADEINVVLTVNGKKKKVINFKVNVIFRYTFSNTPFCIFWFVF